MILDQIVELKAEEVEEDKEKTAALHCPGGTQKLSSEEGF